MSDFLSSRRVHPSSRRDLTPSSSPLSILDNSVSNYTPAGAAWFLPPIEASSSQSSSHPQGVYEADFLAASLAVILSAYPQWAGTLRLVPQDDASPDRTDQNHTNRFGRLEILWGRENDPGVAFTVSTAHTADALASILPVKLNGTSPGPSDGILDASAIPNDLFPPMSDLVSLRKPKGESPTPCMAVRVTGLSGGGAVIAVSIHHSLSDAQGLSTFMNDWSNIHRSMFLSPDVEPPVPSRPFEPLLVDKCAAGSIDAQEENADIERYVLDKLPQLRYDFWASADGKPSMIGSPTSPHESIRALDEKTGSKRGRRLPWETWQIEKTVKDYLFHFTAGQVDALYASAKSSEVASAVDVAQQAEEERLSTERISRLDALLAHLWRLVIRARNLPPDTRCNLNLSIGLRPRLSLPTTFRGSPIIALSPSVTSSTIASATASKIRATLSLLEDSQAIPNLLHHYASALDPIREWNSFAGDENIMLTPWLRIGAYDVDFGGGKAELVHAQMWPIDGLMVIMEAAIKGNEGEQGKWYANGVSVRLCLREEVMSRLISDPDLLP